LSRTAALVWRALPFLGRTGRRPRQRSHPGGPLFCPVCHHAFPLFFRRRSPGGLTHDRHFLWSIFPLSPLSLPLMRKIKKGGGIPAFSSAVLNFAAIWLYGDFPSLSTRKEENGTAL